MDFFYDADPKYKDVGRTQANLIDCGVWELVELTEPMALIHEDDDDIMLRVWTWKVS